MQPIEQLCEPEPEPITLSEYVNDDNVEVWRLMPVSNAVH
jgi:hypothetical protein